VVLRVSCVEGDPWLMAALGESQIMVLKLMKLQVGSAEDLFSDSIVSIRPINGLLANAVSKV
jgi:hypothetical protein